MAEADNNKPLADLQAKLLGEDLKKMLVDRAPATLEAWLKQYSAYDAADAKKKAEIDGDIAAVKSVYSNATLPRSFYVAFYGYLRKYSADAAAQKRFEVFSVLAQPDQKARNDAYVEYAKNPETKKYADEACERYAALNMPTRLTDIREIGKRIYEAATKDAAKNEEKGRQAYKDFEDFISKMYDSATGTFKEWIGSAPAKAAPGKADAAKTDTSIADRQREAEIISGAAGASATGKADGKANEEEKGGIGGWIAGALGGLLGFFGGGAVGRMMGFDGFMGMLLSAALAIAGFMWAKGSGLGEKVAGFVSGKPAGDGKDDKGQARSQVQGQGASAAQGQPPAPYLTKAELDRIKKLAVDQRIPTDVVVLKPLNDTGLVEPTLSRHPDALKGARVATADIENTMLACGRSGFDGQAINFDLNGAVPKIVCVPNATPAPSAAPTR